MQKLFEVSNGSVVLFTDADTVHQPDSLAYAMACMRAHNCDLVSGYPRQITSSIGELFTVPTIYAIKFLLPFVVMSSRSMPPCVSFAIGQYIMVTRDALKSVNGLNCIKNIVCEDIYMAEQLKACKYKVMVVNIANYVHCQMYDNAKHAFHGLAKAILPALRYNKLVILASYPTYFILIWPAMALIVSLMIKLFVNHDYVISRLLLISLALVYSTWFLCLIDERINPIALLLQPCHMVCSMSLLTYSIIAVYVTKSGFIWKGRQVA